MEAVAAAKEAVSAQEAVREEKKKVKRQSSRARATA